MIPRRKTLISMMLISTTALSACTQAQMTTMRNDLTSTLASYGPLIEDECSRFRQPFQQASAERRERINNFAKIGAATGAAAGAAAGGAFGGGLGEALIFGIGGALAGALVGASIGYYQSLEERTSNRAELQNAVNNDATSDLRRVNALTASVAELNRCRTRQIADVTNGVANGELTREQGVERLRTIRTAALQDDSIIRDTTGETAATNALYVDALAKADVRDEESYVAQIERYTPQVTQPRLTAARAGAEISGGLSVTSRRPRSSDPVVELGYGQRELSAAQQANAAAIDDMLDEAEALLATI